MTKYIEIDGIGEVVPRSEYDALAAKLIALTDEIMAIMNDSRGVDGYHLNGAVATWDSFDLLEIILSPPQQHLAEIRAQAGQAGFIAACLSWMGLKNPEGINFPDADRYANSIRQESK